MTIYRNGVAEPNPDPALVELLRDHRWNPLTEGCSCGWSQREGLGRRLAQHNHHIHQAATITSEVARISLHFAEQLIDEPMEQELKRLQASVDRVRRLHAPKEILPLTSSGGVSWWCNECKLSLTDEETGEGPLQCPTMRELDKDKEVER